MSIKDLLAEFMHHEHLQKNVKEALADEGYQRKSEAKSWGLHLL